MSALRTGRLYSFLLEAESTPGPQCDRKDYVTEKFQWHHRESNTKSTNIKLLKLNLHCTGLLQLNTCDQYLHSVTYISFVCMQYSLIQSIFVVITYIRKKSYENCRRRLRIWFPDVSVPSKSESWGRSFPTPILTRSTLNYIPYAYAEM